MRILGAHVGVHSRDEAADQAFFRDVVKLPFIGAGHEFIIFGVPASDIAVHESEAPGHDLYLMCDDVAGFAALMKSKGLKASEPVNRGWGTLMQVTLPGGSTLGVYQPHHKRPKATVVRSGGAKPKTRKAVKASSKSRLATTRATRPRAKARKR